MTDVPRIPKTPDYALLNARLAAGIAAEHRRVLNEAIRNAVDAGASLRNVGNVTGLSHESIRRVALGNLRIAHEQATRIQDSLRAGPPLQPRVFTEVSIARLQTGLLSALAPDIDQAAAWRKMLLPALQGARTLWRDSMPSNWVELAPDEAISVGELMAETGLSLAWVPRVDIVRAILAADADERADVLLAHEGEVVEDLRTCLADVAAPSLQELRAHLAKAVGAYAAGFPEPAQSHAANVFSTTLEVPLSLSFSKAREEFARHRPDDVDIRSFRRAAIYQAARKAIARYVVDEKGGNPPSDFNRHASTHHVSYVQFTPANALASVLLATSLLRELECWEHDRDESSVVEDEQPALPSPTTKTSKQPRHAATKNSKATRGNR